MNAGAYGSEFKDIVVSTEYVDLDSLEVKNINNEEQKFEYRNSIFSAGNKAILSTTLRFVKSNKREIENRIATTEEYNKKIADESPTVSIGDELNSNNVESNSVFDFLKTGNVIGTLIISKINVKLPLYDGLSNDNLQKGVVHLSDTSYPTGQTSTHSVIVGHSGLTRAKILDDLDKLKVGLEYENKIKFTKTKRVFDSSKVYIFIKFVYKLLVSHANHSFLLLYA